MWLLGPCFSGMGGLITLSLERGQMLVSQRNKDGAACGLGGGVEQTLKPVERLQARALGPQGAHPPPWQGCISILCTGLVRPWVTHTG